METIGVHSRIRDEPQSQSIAEGRDGVGHGAATVVAYTMKTTTRRMNDNMAWATVSSDVDFLKSQEAKAKRRNHY